MSFPVALIAAGSFWASAYPVRGKISVRGAPQFYCRVSNPYANAAFCTGFGVTNHFKVFGATCFIQNESNSGIINERRENYKFTPVVLRGFITQRAGVASTKNPVFKIQ
jgi:hypothetical protein